MSNETRLQDSGGAPLVTVLVPAYNRPDTLREALDSALVQTHRNMEIIILDDASPDAKVAVVGQEFAAKDARVQFVRHAENVGIALNWRYGLEKATGKYVTFLHDDDTWEPEFLRKLVATLEANDNAVIAFSDHWLMLTDGHRDENESVASTQRFHRDQLPAGKLADFALQGVLECSVPIVATVFRRALMDPKTCVSPEARGCSDFWIIYNASLVGDAIYVPERLVNYRGHPGGMSHSKPIYMSLGKLFCLNAMGENPSMKRLEPEIRRQQADAYLLMGIAQLRQGDLREARESLSSALKYRRNLRGIVAFTLCNIGPLGTSLARRLRSA